MKPVKVILAEIEGFYSTHMVYFARSTTILRNFLVIVNMTLEQRIHNTHVNNWEISVMHWLSALAVYISLQLIELLTVDLILKM